MIQQHIYSTHKLTNIKKEIKNDFVENIFTIIFYLSIIFALAGSFVAMARIFTPNLYY